MISLEKKVCECIPEDQVFKLLEVYMIRLWLVALMLLFPVVSEAQGRFSRFSSRSRVRTETVTVRPCACVLGDLFLGSNGPQVKALQEMLTAKGYPTRPDGHFGPQTLEALIKWQTAKNLSPTGDWDLQSRAFALEHP